MKTHVSHVLHLHSVKNVLEIEYLLKKLVNVSVQTRHMKPMMNTVPIVATNVQLVSTYPPNVLHVLMKTELILNFAHVKMDGSMKE